MNISKKTWAIIGGAAALVVVPASVSAAVIATHDDTRPAVSERAPQWAGQRDYGMMGGQQGPAVSKEIGTGRRLATGPTATAMGPWAIRLPGRRQVPGDRADPENGAASAREPWTAPALAAADVIQDAARCLRGTAPVVGVRAHLS